MADQCLPSKEQKAEIIGRLISQAPPGELTEVLSDVRILLNDDELLCQVADKAFAQYNIDHFTPVTIDGKKEEVLITPHGKLGNGRFFDPNRNLSFRCDHLRREASDPQPHERDKEKEVWRNAIQTALAAYVKQHYPTGVCSVYEKTEDNQQLYVACVEAHLYRPRSFWNGLWKSEWSLLLTSHLIQLTGNIKVETHYFEDGNAHIMVSEDFADAFCAANERQAALAFVEIVEKADNELQTSLMEEIQALSDTAFKGLRRSLPVVRTSIDWCKIIKSQIVEVEPGC
ncbi:F-actin-capping protein subunit alpha-2 [Latimeria chalumnae]|uniref:F-actin-capping protein subunit alpha n=1 Tax=Latimeria chalumnae TaxID=7897 RepID=H3A074_LATCH|nr:PREDICTED: F-actin-capping protein subunit alpha-3 [Latimeria chalumnae]|eukprot:XP_006002300.1 PREDICTED: F-actin-capping protein subunit alpha-3 [Latimeria chalumnae]